MSDVERPNLYAVPNGDEREVGPDLRLGYFDDSEARKRALRLQRAFRSLAEYGRGLDWQGRNQVAEALYEFSIEASELADTIDM